MKCTKFRRTKNGIIRYMAACRSPSLQPSLDPRRASSPSSDTSESRPHPNNPTKIIFSDHMYDNSPTDTWLREFPGYASPNQRPASGEPQPLVRQPWPVCTSDGRCDNAPAGSSFSSHLASARRATLMNVILLRWSPMPQRM
jgi:hypothetical protein